MSAKRKPTARPPSIDEQFVQDVRDQLAGGKRVRRALPDRGRIHVDRPLPFLCVYRRPAKRPDAGTDRLVRGEAAYLIGSGSARQRSGLAALTSGIAEVMGRQFGGFLVVEIWAGADEAESDAAEGAEPTPTFRVVAPRSAVPTRTVETLVARLQRIEVQKRAVRVEVTRSVAVHPPGMRSLLSPDGSREIPVWVVGLEVPPVYRDRESGQEFPLVLRALRRSLGLALRQAFYVFAKHRTTQRPKHYLALGRRAVVKAVREVDRQLAEIGSQFDYLLQLTPVNSNDAWNAFRRSRWQRAPELRYRPLAIDPMLLKRALFRIPLERVEDAVLYTLFHEKQLELERKLTMLEDRDTPRFLHGSLQLFGAVEPELLRLAGELLERVRVRRKNARLGTVTPHQFAERARQEVAYYRASYPGFSADVTTSDEVVSLMVSQGNLLVPARSAMSERRVEALLAHEVGTHLVTYYNGRAQPLHQLYSGLANYEQLQEGLAVLSEHLVGGLTGERVRQLAARVVAVHMQIDGASFVDTFRVLHDDHRFPERSAFAITLRVYRAGGLTKDAAYLRGLLQVLEYLHSGGELENLLIGKIATEHLPLVEELRLRGVLVAPPLRPRHLELAQAQERLARLRESRLAVADLVDDRANSRGARKTPKRGRSTPDETARQRGEPQ